MAAGVLCGILLWACAAPRPLEVNTPQGKAENYPPVIEASAARQQAAEDAWRLLLGEYRIPDVKPDLEPVLYTPHALPPDLANRINLNPKGGTLSEVEAKEALRRFIERWHPILGGGQRNSTLSLKDLSLVSFTDEGSFYRAAYRQMSYAFPLANGYGELRLALGKAGALLQMSSSLVPTVELPARAAIEPQAVADKLMNRDFTYTNIAGRPLSYRVTRRDEISVKDLVVYPKPENNRLAFRLAYPVEVGRGTTWTVYVDAMTGQEIEVKQNFQS